ncbi:MAG: 5-deoxy-glucuronate isomerase, partial [Lachnospiraceae bacterium]|nr:5-deoxy-glucuronate isomerase [Lachnospiraceae bacterium]
FLADLIQNLFLMFFVTGLLLLLQLPGQRRQVLTVFDYENAPYSNMVMGEVFHKPGCWSSYPPHFHPQPELYYYEFDKPQGFGVGFVGEECFRVEDQGCLAITPMHAHQQAAAPGYRMYYAWLIRHLEGDPWRKTRIVDPAHEWLDTSDYQT